ncbi:MAG: DOMON-like domain-containing protein [Gammaproteobacteria bacterium]
MPSADGVVRALVANVAREDAGVLRFDYALEATVSRIRVPSRRPSSQADELWKHTCFEAFIAPAVGGDEYREINFSPSTEWATYAFTSYRKGMTSVALAAAPRIEVSESGSQLTVQARIGTAGLLPESWRAPGAKLRIALAAVIEGDGGKLSYWALRHAPDKADFHHSAGFILEV